MHTVYLGGIISIVFSLFFSAPLRAEISGPTGLAEAILQRNLGQNASTSGTVINSCKLGIQEAMSVVDHLWRISCQGQQWRNSLLQESYDQIFDLSVAGITRIPQGPINLAAYQSCFLATLTVTKYFLHNAGVNGAEAVLELVSQLWEQSDLIRTQSPLSPNENQSRQVMDSLIQLTNLRSQEQCSRYTNAMEQMRAAHPSLARVPGFGGHRSNIEVSRCTDEQLETAIAFDQRLDYEPTVVSALIPPGILVSGYLLAGAASPSGRAILRAVAGGFTSRSARRALQTVGSTAAVLASSTAAAQSESRTGTSASASQYTLYQLNRQGLPMASVGVCYR